MSIRWEDKARTAAYRSLVEWMAISSKLMNELLSKAKTTEEKLHLLEQHGKFAERIGMFSPRAAEESNPQKRPQKPDVRVIRRPFGG